jgi:hypothetical protein
MAARAVITVIESDAAVSGNTPEGAQHLVMLLGLTNFNDRQTATLILIRRDLSPGLRQQRFFFRQK